MAARGTSVSSFESETFGDSTLRGSSELINGQERGTRTRRSSARHRSRLSSFFAPPQIRSDPKEAKFLLETLSSKQVTWQTLNLCSAIVLSVTYTLAMSLFARRFEAALPALNLVDRVVVYCFCVLQLTFTIVYFLRLYRYGWIRCTFEMRSCFLQGLFIFFTMNMIGNIARTISEASGTTIAILYVSDLVWQWFWIFGFYGHAMAILRLYRDIKDRHTFLERNHVVFGLCFIIASVETAICGWSRTALGLTWPGMLVQFAMRGHQQQVAYSLTFALVVTMRIFLDGWIAMELYRTFRVLQQLPYTCCHHKQMGARFYRVFTAISYIFLIANDTIAVGLVPLPSANASLDGVPLRLLGIARFNGGAFAMLFTWSVLLLYVHLPPTVLGVWLPWIVALAPDPAAYQEKRAPQRSVYSEWELSAHSASQAAPWPADALDAERELRKANLYYQTEQEALRNGDSWLSRSLVLETHVLIFNMAYLSYRPWHDPHMYAEMFNHYGVGEMDPLQARVVRHISSAVTDVHVLVIDLADRIVVSFRGTKSTRNLRTDMNVRRVPLEEHLHARECPQIQDTWRLSACSKHGQRGSLRESPAKATVDGTTRMPRTTNAVSTIALAAGRSGTSAATCSQIPPATHSKREIDSTRKHQASVEAFAKDDSDIERGLDDALSQELGLDPGGRFAHRRWWQYMLSVRGIRSLRFGDFRAQAGEDFSYLIGRRVPTKVHDGFLHAYLSVREELMETLKPLVAKPSSTAPTAVDAACAPLSSTCGDATCGVATSLDRRVQPSNRFPKVSSADIHGGCEHGQQQQQLSLVGRETAARCRSETATAAAAAADASEAQSCSAMTSLDSASCNHKPVIFCGHSLGGALATIAALDMTCFENSQSLRLSSDLVMCVTFGSPRVGNRAFAAAFQRHVPFSFRWAAVGDIVTKLPFWGYEHVPVKVMLDPLSGSILMDPSIIEESMVAFRNSLDAHLRPAYIQGFERWCRRYHPRWNVQFWDFHDVFDDHALGAALESIT